MSGRQSRTRRALGAAEGRSRSLVPCDRTEGCSRSLAPYALNALRSLAPPGGSAYTQLAAGDASLFPWPPLQCNRDLSVRLNLERLLGAGPYSQPYGVAVPEPEAKLVAAAIEAEAFASASEFASDADRMEVYRIYCQENFRRLLDFFKSRAALGESSATALPLAASASEE